MGWSGLLWVLRLSCFLIQILSSFKALKKPTVRQRRTKEGNAIVRTTMSSAERTRRRLVKEQLMSWVVLACFRVAEKLSDVALGWLPLYDEAKVMIFVSMLAWRSAGAQLVYTNILTPLIKPYERPLDLVGHALHEVLEVAVYLLLVGPRWLHKRILAFRKPDIPNILASLRKPGQPAIAHQVATSIELAQAFPSSSSTSFRPIPPPPFLPLTETRTILKTVEQHPPAPSSSSQPFRPMTNTRRSVSSGLSSIPKSTSTSTGVTQLRRVSSRSTLKEDMKAEGLYPSLRGLATDAPFATTDRKGKGRERSSDQYLDPTVPFPRSTVIPPNIPRPIILTPPDPISQSISIPPILAPALSPPRATQPPVPETPAPPGAFVSRSFSRTPTKSAPFRDPNVDEMDVDLPSETAAIPLAIVPPTPRQKALSAIADLSSEMDAANDEKPDWATGSKAKSKSGSALVGRNGKRKVSDDVVGGLEGSPGKRKRVSSSIGLSRSTSSAVLQREKPLPRSRTTTRLGTEGDEAKVGSSRTLAESRSSATLSRSRSSAALSKRKMAAAKEEEDDEDDGDETAKEDAGRTAPTRRKRSTISASTTSSIPLPRSRSSAKLPSSSNSTSRRSGAPPPSSSNSHPPDAESTAPSESSSDSDSVVASRPAAAPKARRVPISTSDSKASNGTAPARKAKRVLLRPTQDVQEDDSGIPIVGRKKVK